MSPSKDSAAGRAYLALQQQARGDKRPVQELLVLYVLEGFLDRLAHSAERDAFVLKGGVLLAAFDLRRPTRDVDLQAQALDNEAGLVLERIKAIAAVEIDDGVEYDIAGATVAVIRGDDTYTGVRVSLGASLDRARLPFHVDVSVGDPIYPAPQDVELPRLLGGTIHVLGYPLGLVHAEKIVTAIARGTVNTRWRDFVDVVGLSREHPVAGAELVAAIGEVARHRGVELQPLAEVLEGYGDIGQARWAAWRRKQQLEDRTPERFGELITNFIGFADPAVSGAARNRAWSPEALDWT